MDRFIGGDDGDVSSNMRPTAMASDCGRYCVEAMLSYLLNHIIWHKEGCWHAVTYVEEFIPRVAHGVKLDR